MTSRAPRALAPCSLQSASRGWPDAFGIILADDTRLILTFEAEEARQRGLARVGHVWSHSAVSALELCVTLCGCCADIRPIAWLDEATLTALLADPVLAVPVPLLHHHNPTR